MVEIASDLKGVYIPWLSPCKDTIAPLSVSSIRKVVCIAYDPDTSRREMRLSLLQYPWLPETSGPIYETFPAWGHPVQAAPLVPSSGKHKHCVISEIDIG